MVAVSDAARGISDWFKMLICDLYPDKTTSHFPVYTSLRTSGFWEKSKGVLFVSFSVDREEHWAIFKLTVWAFAIKK